ncbi:MAG: ATP-binding protein [Bacteroidetes bacterium]|nr:ATP-binding protein [Bacteroidota bacterium]
MDPYILKLIQEGEHQQLDFKFEISDARKIARTMAAFANTDGGRLLIGVKDDGFIAGVRSEEEIFMIEVAARQYCKPRVKFETRRWETKKKTVVEVIIHPSEKRPHYAQETEDSWVVYIRVKDQNLVANKILLKVWEREKNQIDSTLSFSNGEEILLQYLQENETITFGGFCLLAGIPSHIAEDVLVNLVSMNILKMEFSGKGVLYRLNREVFER